jgi:hypothetical protein
MRIQLNRLERTYVYACFLLVGAMIAAGLI